MTIEEAEAEMEKRNWTFIRAFNSGIIAVGPLEYGMMKVLAIDVDPARAVEKAIKAVEAKS